MKKLSSLSVMLIALIVIFVSCSKYGSNTGDDDNSSIQIKDSEIQGVWKRNNLYFISFTSNGRYTFCIDNVLMGAGSYKLEKENIILENGYLYIKDTLNIKVNNQSLNLQGNLSYFMQNKKTHINYNFNKTTEAASPSKVGMKISFLSGLNVYYENLSQSIVYQTDYIAKYVYDGYSKSTGKYKIIKEYTWYYVCLGQYTYTQETQGNGEVVIYNLEYNSGFNNSIVKQ